MTTFLRQRIMRNEVRNGRKSKKNVIQDDMFNKRKVMTRGIANSWSVPNGNNRGDHSFRRVQ